MQYDRWAEGYDRRWRRYSAVTHGALLTALDLSSVHDVLDAGCGTGLLIARLLRREPMLRITGLDPNAGMLAVARQRLSGREVRLIQAGAERLPLPDGAFDLVIMANVLHYLEHPLAALLEAYRVLRPDGRVAVVDYLPRGPLPRLADRLIRLYDRGHRRTHDRQELARLLRRGGFEVRDARCLGINVLLRGVVMVSLPLQPPSDIALRGRRET